MSAGSSLPSGLREAVEAALREAVGGDGAIESAAPVGGGCINPSRRVRTSDGGTWFLKWNDADLPDLFRREAEGLRALREAARGTALRIPEVVAVGGEGEGARAGFLVLEWLPPGDPVADYGALLGEGLARLHAPERVPGAEGGSPWGWEADNWIGSLPQSNAPRGGWAEFWWEERIRPRWEHARSDGALDGPGDRRTFERVRERLPGLLAPAGDDGPSLLHGDLWSGNVHPGPDGRPVLIDPAVYRGHREVDLAMAELFGGFPAGFLAAYRDARPLQDGYAEGRRAAYQLYPLLVHVNLFGGGYVGRAREAAGRVAGS